MTGGEVAEELKLWRKLAHVTCLWIGLPLITLPSGELLCDKNIVAQKSDTTRAARIHVLANLVKVPSARELLSGDVDL